MNWPATSAFNLLLKKVPGVRMASLLLVTTGTVGSEMIVGKDRQSLGDDIEREQRFALRENLFTQ